MSYILSETLQKPGRKIKKKKGGKKRETIQRFVLLLVKIILELLEQHKKPVKESELKRFEKTVGRRATAMAVEGCIAGLLDVHRLPLPSPLVFFQKSFKHTLKIYRKTNPIYNIMLPFFDSLSITAKLGHLFFFHFSLAFITGIRMRPRLWEFTI